MTTLTRRRDPGRSEETWLIFYGDVHAGTIGRAVGNPGAVGIGIAGSIPAAIQVSSRMVQRTAFTKRGQPLNGTGRSS